MYGGPSSGAPTPSTEGSWWLQISRLAGVLFPELRRWDAGGARRRSRSEEPSGSGDRLSAPVSWQPGVKSWKGGAGSL